MDMMRVNGTVLHYAVDGDPNGVPVVFSNSLGTDFRLWDQVLPLLPAGLRILRYDKRGHGLSATPQEAFSMGDLVGDLAGLMDALDMRDALVVGLSIGGLIAQGLAAERPDLVRAVVLSNTGARIGNEQMWAPRLETVAKDGVEALADATMDRWFSRNMHANRADEMLGWRNMLTRTTVEGYARCMEAISHTDLFDSTARLRLPTMGIAGSEDGSTPPDLVRETTNLVPGSRFELIQGAGHLPCVEKPEEYAALLTDFIAATAHLKPAP